MFTDSKLGQISLYWPNLNNQSFTSSIRFILSLFLQFKVYKLFQEDVTIVTLFIVVRLVAYSTYQLLDSLSKCESLFMLV